VRQIVTAALTTGIAPRYEQPNNVQPDRVRVLASVLPHQDEQEQTTHTVRNSNIFFIIDK